VFFENYMLPFVLLNAPAFKKSRHPVGLQVGEAEKSRSFVSGDK
jgi:hypothetical protein